MPEEEKKEDNPLEDAKEVASTMETAGCGCLNLVLLLIILAIGSIIAVLLDVTTIKGLSKIAGYAWKAASNAIVSIFK